MEENDSILLKMQIKELNDIREEICDLEKKIKKLEGKAVVSDIVQTSSDFFPFTKYNKKIIGKNKELVEALDGYINDLKLRLKALIETQRKLEQFIEKLPTSRLRRIFELRCIEQWSWKKIAFAIGGHATEESIRKEYDRCFEKK